MLSPPPSPLPDASYADSYFHQAHSQVALRKQSVGRTYRLLVVLVPIILVFITAAVRPSSFPEQWHLESLFAEHWTHLTRQLSWQGPNTDSSIVVKRQSGTPEVTSSNSGTSISTGLPPVPTNAPTATGVVPTPFPAAFDISLSLNFTSASCQNFFVNFTQADSFRRCRPFSLLLSTSSAFASSQSNATLLTDIMWGTCNTVESEASCHSTMDDLASMIQSECNIDLQDGNILANEALNGFQVYAPMREAGCLIDNSTGSYCFVVAATSKDSSDLEYYRLPSGIGLSNGTVPTCSSCVKSVLAIYAQAVTAPPNTAFPTSTASSQDTSGTPVPENRATIPLDQTYGPAAQLAAQQCGSVYAQQVDVNSASVLRVLRWRNSMVMLLPFLMAQITLF